VKSPDLLGAYYLFLLCLLVPWLAWRSRAQLKAMEAAGVYPAAKRMYLSSIVQLLLIGAFAWWVGRSWNFDPFAAPVVGVREWLAGAAVLIVNIGIMEISRRNRTDDERRTMFVYRLAPRSTSDVALFVVVAIVAGVCEELAYRGVLLGLLHSVTGVSWLAYGIATLAFTAAHAMQGLKSAAAILVMTILFHALVAFTGTLIVAMVIHTVYDVIAGLAARREAITVEAIAVEARSALHATT
jgi:membrane protease YdiL (CAAX protease family)